jgi:endonuclease YncB( thermonuclease family)
MKHWLLAAALLLASTAHALSYRGVVTHVTDGDTLWVRPASGKAPVEIRLLDVDAPEGCQPHGPQAAQALRSRLLRQGVRVRAQGRDDYQRQLARIEHRGDDVGGWLVREGHAWSMRFHGRPGAYASLEAQARRERKGLWAHSGAMEPRKFRQRFGRCR